MYIEFIDLLRCPRAHEETWLVAAFTRMDGRFIREGKLGCLVCNASYPIENGVADLRDPHSIESSIGQLSPDPATHAHSDPEQAMRIAAMLGLIRPGSLIVMSGREAALAEEVSELTECRVIALNPRASVRDTEKVARVMAGSRIPLASSSLDGIVITGDIGIAADAGRVLKPGGRLVTNMMSKLSPELRELARDEDYLVAESVGPLTSLSR